MTSRPLTAPAARSTARRPAVAAAAAVAGALVLVTGGCQFLPGSGPGTGPDPGAASESPVPGGTAEEPDPADATGSVAAAAERVEAADSYDIRVVLTHESGDPFRSLGGGYAYTSTPEETVRTNLGGDGAVSAVYHANARRTLLAYGDDLHAVVDQPTPADRYNTDFAVGSALLRQILDSSADLTHDGEEAVEVQYTDRSAEGSYETVQETVPAQRYSGTFTASVTDFTDRGAGLALELSEYPDSPFTLWIGEDGYPVKLEHTSGEYARTHTFAEFDGPVEVDFPAPGDPVTG
ncbi:hypothetical protein [Nocardiopsis sp. FIRDI 009]|uniref:hypothetical protein n=1 Tax=Nocardiopsis sp. FIRDI 009 TaxID=714197 RepID=UPI000E259A1A|nr:hypothetical protein [Nocardiopsis sp. FIRDI 009]